MNGLSSGNIYTDGPYRSGPYGPYRSWVPRNWIPDGPKYIDFVRLRNQRLQTIPFDPSCQVSVKEVFLSICF